MVFENRTLTVPAYVFADDKSNYDIIIIIGNSFSNKRSANINFGFASEDLSHIPSINNIEIAKSFISRNATQEDFETEDDSLPPLISDASDWTEESMLEQDL